MRHAPILAAPARSASDRDRWKVAALWLLACAVLLALHRHGVATGAYPDPDDRLRLVEVRDWLGSQRFRDVSQHRMNQPFGAPMHWSRLVDLPIAASIVLLRPFVGDALAERIAVTIVPLATLGIAMAAVASIGRRLAGRGAALLSAALVPTAVAAAVQFQPLRIDHHGWEIALSLAGLAAILRPDARRGGPLAGLALAVALQVSLEVLPFAVALGGALGLHWIAAPASRTRARLIGYVAMLAAAEAALFMALHGPGQWGVYCDAVSPPHLLGLAVAAIGVALVASRHPAHRAARAAWLGLVGVAAAAAFRAVPPSCGIDAFAALEPIVRTEWYDMVAEGQPIWHVGLATAASVIGFPLIALPCALVAWWRSKRGEWGVYTAMLVATGATAVMVLRAGGLANLVALPAAAWATTRLVARAQASGGALIRVGGTVAAVAALSPPATPLLALLASPASSPPTGRASPGACSDDAAFARLAILPTGRFLAPFDVGPAILLDTPHGVLASGHHRNHLAMADELRAWLGDTRIAHAVLRRHGIGYVLTCELPETRLYRSTAPQGFAARLASGRAPPWLTPVPLAGAPFRVWRVNPL